MNESQADDQQQPAPTSSDRQPEETRLHRVVPLLTWGGSVGFAAILLTRPEWLWDMGVDRVAPIVVIAGLLGVVDLFLLRARRIVRATVAAAPLVLLCAASLHVEVGWDGESEPRVLTSPASSGTLRVAVLGDFGRKSEASFDLGHEIAKAFPPYDLVLLLGDNLYGSEPFPEAMERRIDQPLAEVIAEGLPIHAILGSHDIRQGYGPDEIRDRRLGMEGQRFYELRSEDNLVSFFMIDSERLPFDPYQYRWLKSAVHQSKSKWKILVSHGPPEASRVAHSDERHLKRMLAPLFASDRIQLVLSGKNHVYERRVGAASPSLLVTIGSSGRVSNREFPPDELRIADYVHDEVYLSLAIDANAMHLRAVNTTGDVVDEADWVP